MCMVVSICDKVVKNNSYMFHFLAYKKILISVIFHMTFYDLCSAASTNAKLTEHTGMFPLSSLQ